MDIIHLEQEYIYTGSILTDLKKINILDTFYSNNCKLIKYES